VGSKSVKRSSTKSTKLLFRDLLAGILWLALISKLFIYDWDVAILQSLGPFGSFLLSSKLPILLAIILLGWCIFKSRRFFGFIARVLFFPIYFLVPKILKRIFKSWNSVLAIYFLATELLKSFRSALLTTVLWIIGVLLILYDLSIEFNVFAVFLLYACLIYHYYLVFRSSIAAPGLIRETISLLKNKWPSCRDKYVLDELKVDTSQPDSAKTHSMDNKSLASVVILNRFALKAAITIRDIGLNPFVLGYVLFTLGWLFFLTVTSSGLQYYVLNSISTSHFLAPSNSGPLIYIYFAFMRLLTISVASIEPSSSIARVMVSVESIFSLFLAFILVYAVGTLKRERYREESAKLVSELKHAAQEIEVGLKDRLALTIAEAIHKLEEDNSKYLEQIKKIDVTQDDFVD
jgi:hypothetical protein